MTDDPRNIWKTQETEQTTMTLEDIRKKLGRIRLRNRITVCVGVAIAAEFALMAVSSTSILARVGWGLVILGTLSLLYRRVRIWSWVEHDQRGAASIQFYREAVKSCAAFPRGGLLLFVGCLVLLVPIVVGAWRNPPPLKAILPFCMILALWGVSFVYIGRRQRRWVKRELELLDGIDGESSKRGENL